MRTNTVQLFQKSGLSTNREYTYSEVANSFLSEGFTSNAGNTYFNSIRLIEGIFIKEDIGHGHTHTFINSIRIYNIEDKALIAERNYDRKIYRRYIIINEVQEMLFDVLKEAAIIEGTRLDEATIKSHIQQITLKYFNTDQRQLLQTIQNKSLTA